MSSRQIDGTVIVAKLKRRVLGGAVYRQVTIRRGDGSSEDFGTIMAGSDLRDALVPGTRGRFYFHNILGQKGLHGFRPVGGTARSHFPRAFEILFGVIGLLNLKLYLLFLLMDGDVREYLFLFGGLGIICSIIFFTSRRALLRQVGADDGRPEAATATSRTAGELTS